MMTTANSDEVKFPEMWFGARTFCKFLVYAFSFYRPIGKENIPTTQYLMTSNHLSYLDVPAIVASFGKIKMAGFTAKKYQGTWMEIFFRMGSPVWIDQDSPDRQALTTALKLIKQGYNFGIAPEGHRSKTGGLLEGREGAAFLATRANLPIHPVGLFGTERIFKHPRPKAYVVYGKPYRLPEGRAKGDVLAEYTERIMCAIAALLPKSYHGYYAGNPLIEEMAPIVRPDGYNPDDYETRR